MLKKKFKLVAILTLLLVLFTTTVFATAELSDMVPISAPISEDETEHYEGDGHDHSGDVEAILDSLNNMEIHNGPMYMTENNIVLDKHIDGNAFLIGDSVTVNGDINGDLYVLANTIKINGNIYGNVFAASQSVEFSSIVYLDVYAFGLKVTLNDMAQIGRDVNIYAQDLSINSLIGRNAHISSEKVNIGNSSKIYGDFNYTSSNEISVPEGIVAGEVKFEESKEYEVQKPSISQLIGNYSFNLITTIVCAAIIWLLILWISPKFFEKSANILENKLWPSIGLGFGALFLTPIVTLILFITIIGMLVSLGLISLYTLGLILANTVLAIAIAGFAVKKFNLKSFHKNFWYVLCAVAALWVLRQLPFVGGWVSFLGIVIGMGILVVSIFSKDTKLEIKEDNVEVIQ